MTTPTTTHSCPGHCGRRVAHARYACLQCWYRLPGELRNGIVDTMGLNVLEPRRRVALGAAGEWYREHPPSSEAPL